MTSMFLLWKWPRRQQHALAGVVGDFCMPPGGAGDGRYISASIYTKLTDLFQNHS